MPAGAGTSNLHQQRMPGGVYIASSGGLKGGWKRDKEALKRLRRGWYLGSEAFKKELLERMAGQLGEHHSGELHLESAEAKAERIVGEELQRRGWKDSEDTRAMLDHSFELLPMPVPTTVDSCNNEPNYGLTSVG